MMVQGTYGFLVWATTWAGTCYLGRSAAHPVRTFRLSCPDHSIDVHKPPHRQLSAIGHLSQLYLGESFVLAMGVGGREVEDVDEK